ncbi:MAG: hypothetical protein ACYTJ0_21705, partial [Planctomycetota bacterium]
KKVLREDRPPLGIDHFEPGRTERLGDTPAVIARVFRGREMRRTMLVSAEDSYDVNDRPLEYRWVVLRGDPDRIAIRPRNDTGSRVEITVAHHSRRPVAPGSDLESNRVDLGVFVHNGRYWSAPGFVTWFFLDDETRTYDERGRAVDIGYGLGATTVSVTDWGALGELVASDGLVARRLALSKPERELVAQAAPRHAGLDAARVAAQEESDRAAAADREASDVLKAAEREQDAAEAAWSPRSKARRRALDEARDAVAAAKRRREDTRRAARAAREARDEAAAALDRYLHAPRLGIGRSLTDVVRRAIDALLVEPDLLDDESGDLAPLLARADPAVRASIGTARRKLVGFGLLVETDDDEPQVTPARAGPGPLVERLTACERALLREHNATVLTRLLCPGVFEASHRVNFVDERIATPKGWRDVFAYDADGTCVGWTRYDGDDVRTFNAAGQ